MKKSVGPARVWRFPVALEGGRVPLAIQIARAISRDVERGRLGPGDRLPGARTLAGTLGVHRNTVLAAYDELQAEGWIETAPARGTFVSSELSVAPKSGRSAAGRWPEEAPYPMRASLDLPVRSLPKGAINLAGGTLDVRFVPLPSLARAYRRALRAEGASLLSYGPADGHPRLRRALAAMLAETRGLAIGPEELIVTRGSQMALDLAARALIRPGDRVLVEAFGYRPAWAALEGHGAELVPIPVDRDGIDVDAVEAARGAKALYLTPHHQYPTMVTLSAARRLRLLELAKARSLVILEDDYDHEFHYEGRPVLPLASADHGGWVVYIGTLSKVLAPGLRLGFVAGPRGFVRRIAELRHVVDRQGDLALERAVAELIEDGEIERHVRRARRIYRDRRARMFEALEAFGDALSFDRPSGGMSLWVRVDPSVAPDRWVKAGLEEGVVFDAGRRFEFGDKAIPFVRLGFAGLEPKELAVGIERLRRAFRAAKR